MAYNLSPTFCHYKRYCGPPCHLMVSRKLGLACRKNVFLSHFTLVNSFFLIATKKSAPFYSTIKKPVYEVSVGGQHTIEPMLCLVPRSMYWNGHLSSGEVTSHVKLVSMPHDVRSGTPLKWS